MLTCCPGGYVHPPPPPSVLREQVRKLQPNRGDDLLSWTAGKAFQKHPAVIAGADTKASLLVIMAGTSSGVAFGRFLDRLQKGQDPV